MKIHQLAKRRTPEMVVVVVVVVVVRYGLVYRSTSDGGVKRLALC